MDKKFLDIINPIPKKGACINGYKQGVWFTIILTAVLSLVVCLLLWKLPVPKNEWTFLLACLAVASVTIPFCFGKRFWSKVESGHKGVPTPMGGRTEQFTYDEGLIWKPPEPLMGFIPVDIRETDYNMNGTVALSKDLVPVIIDFSVKAMVIDPYASTWIEGLEKSIVDLFLREARNFIGDTKSTKTPYTKEALRNYLRDQCEKETMEIRGEKGEIKKRSWGVKFPRIFVTDIRLPKSLEDAYVQKQVEKALAIANLVRVSNLAKGVRAIKANKLLAMNDEEILNAVQTEYGTADRIIVDGSDPVSRAAAILISGKKEPKEVVKNNE